MSGIARKLMGVTKGANSALTYEHLASYSETSDTGSFTETYTNAPLGSPQSDRHILGICYSSVSVANGLDISSASFAGVSATREVNHNALGGFNVAAYFLANVQSGTSGTISWSGTITSGVSTRRHIVLYAIYGSPTVVTSGFSAAGSTSSSSGTVNLPSLLADDIVFALAGNNTSATHTWSPTYLDKDYEEVFDANRCRSVVSGRVASSGAQTITCVFGASGVQANLSAVAIRR